MRRGFTLIELIVVVIVVGILASFALPQYLKATERAYGGKAVNSMGLIAQAEKLYRADNNAYIAVAADGGADAILGSYVELKDVDADAEWAYTVVATATTFTITATRTGGTLTLNQDGIWGGTGYGATGRWKP